MPEIQKTWVRFKQFSRTSHQELRETSDLTVEDTVRNHANMVRDVIAGIQKALQKYQAHTETPTVVQAPVDHVSNTVQNTQQQLATQIQKIQSMMQDMQMQITKVPHGTRRNYGVRLDYGGCGYHGNQSSYRGRGGRSAQNNGNWRGGRGGRDNSNLTHYCWTQGMCDHTGKDCRTPAHGQQKDAVRCNNIPSSERNFTL